MSLIATWDTFRQEGNARTGQHSLEIIDSQGSINGEFEIDFNTGGFELLTGGEPQQLWPGIQPMTCRFQMYIRTNAHLNFVRAIADNTDISRFTVVYRRGGGRGGFVAQGRPLFVGAILTEGTKLIRGARIRDNTSFVVDGSMTVTAVDGITLLQHKGVFQGLIAIRKTIAEWIAEAIRDMPTADYLLPAPILFQTSWVPDTGTANFPLNQQISARALYQYHQRLGGGEIHNWWHVITAICEAFNMRCRYAYGYYFFQQLEDTSAVGYLYNKDGTFAGTFPLSSQVQYADDDDILAIEPHVEGYDPPILRSRVDYHFRFNENLADGKKFQSNGTGGGGEICETVVHGGLNVVTVKNTQTRLRVIGSIEYIPYDTPGYLGELRPVFWLKIKITSAGSTQWYGRDILTTGDFFYYNYAEENWTTSETPYYLIPTLFTMPDSHEKPFFLPVYFSTKPLPAALDNGKIEICFGAHLYKYNASTGASERAFEVTLTSTLDDLDITLLDVENQVVERTMIRTELLNNINNTKTIEREISFSSGPNEGSFNRITDDSDPPVSTQNWTLPGMGSDLHYIQLAKSLLARGMRTQVWMNTLIEGPVQNLIPLNICGATWIWWTGTYSIYQGQEWHKGEWLQVKVDPIDLTETLEDVYDVLERPPIPTIGQGGGRVVEREITGIVTNRINADTHKIPMPDTTDWDHERIRDIVTYNQAGNIMRYKFPATIQNEFYFDSATRDFVLSERPFRSDIWNVFRVYLPEGN